LFHGRVVGSNFDPKKNREHFLSGAAPHQAPQKTHPADTNRPFFSLAKFPQILKLKIENEFFWGFQFEKNP
jgi:hypothetical protein